jgi:small-conductance mechanosensitive channel
MNLRELTQDQQGILDLVENGDLTLDDVKDHLDQLTQDRSKKIENCLHVINRLDSSAAAIAVEIERLTAMQKAATNNAKKARDWLLMNLEDGEKHEFDLFKVSRVKGRQVVNVTDESKLFSMYIKTKEVTSVDKKLLLADLKQGVEVDGAEIAIGNPSLRIK